MPIAAQRRLRESKASCIEVHQSDISIAALPLLPPQLQRLGLDLWQPQSEDAALPGANSQSAPARPVPSIQAAAHSALMRIPDATLRTDAPWTSLTRRALRTAN